MFCPKCKNYLDISRNAPIVVDKSTNSIIISEVSKIFDFVNTDTTETIEPIEITDQKYIVTFSEDMLKKYPKFVKTNAANKKKILAFYDKYKKEDINMYKKVYFICNRCGYQTIIQPQTILYSQDLDRNSLILTDDDYTLMTNDPTLPRTKDYVCINPKCITHDKKKYKEKEAILVRDSKTYRLTYVCCICHTNWTI
jgi:hypothetical protein